MAIRSPEMITKPISWRTLGSRYTVGYLFLLPALILYGLFIAYPFIGSLIYSLTDWNGISPDQNFIGIGNYTQILQDPLFWESLKHNVIWMLVEGPAAIAIGLFLAILVWSQPRGMLFFRTVFFLPQVLGAGILGVVWLIIYQPRSGLLYAIGKALGISFLLKSPIGDYNTALWALLAAAVWASVGFYFVLMLAGLQNVNMELVDAAKVDGANAIQRFIHVIIPQLSHLLTTVSILAVIGSIKVFGLVWAVTQGGPAHATEVIATYAYTNFSKFSEVGYSTALTMFMAVIALIISVIFIWLRERNAE